MIQNGQLISLLEKSFSFWDKISDLEKAALMDNISDIKYEKGPASAEVMIPVQESSSSDRGRSESTCFPRMART